MVLYSENHCFLLFLLDIILSKDGEVQVSTQLIGENEEWNSKKPKFLASVWGQAWLLEKRDIGKENGIDKWNIKMVACSLGEMERKKERERIVEILRYKHWKDGRRNSQETKNVRSKGKILAFVVFGRFLSEDHKQEREVKTNTEVRLSAV